MSDRRQRRSEIVLFVSALLDDLPDGRQSAVETVETLLADDRGRQRSDLVRQPDEPGPGLLRAALALLLHGGDGEVAGHGLSLWLPAMEFGSSTLSSTRA